MVFSSIIFLFGYLPIVFAGNILLRKHIKILNIFLLLASLTFYAWGEPKYVLCMLFSIVFNWMAAVFIGKYQSEGMRNGILALSVIINIGLLFVCKYLNWCISIINNVLDLRLSQTSISLPIGISFYTFQALSYVIDVWRNDVRAQKNIVNVGLYISLFPQLIAGPIVRYEDIEKQIMDRTLSVSEISSGIERFIAGISKKVLLADSMAVIADKAFSVNSGRGVLFAWAGAVAYALQIYYDFSGYSDMAIGLGKMLGFTFKENFNYPYLADSITDFWRRWHISLSSWFRDYIYIPLGGNRKGRVRTFFNLGIVWLTTGIWHGANFTFLFWGCAYGILIMIEKLFQIPQKLKNNRVFALPYRIFTILVILLCWVVFRAENISAAIHYIETMLGLHHLGNNTALAALYIKEYRWELLWGLLLSFPIVPYLKERTSGKISGLILCCEYVLFGISISYLIKGSYSPFIYFNF